MTSTDDSSPGEHPAQVGRPRRGSTIPSDPTRVRVHFRPQAWIRNQAVDADPNGPTDYTVPAAEAKDATGRWLEDCSYESDTLRAHPDAPSWIREWSGPFEIELDVDRAATP